MHQGRIITIWIYSLSSESVSSVDCDLLFLVCVCVRLFVLLLDMADGFGFIEPWLNADYRFSLNVVRSGMRDVYAFRLAYIVPPPTLLPPFGLPRDLRVQKITKIKIIWPQIELLLFIFNRFLAVVSPVVRCRLRFIFILSKCNSFSL